MTTRAITVAEQFLRLLFPDMPEGWQVELRAFAEGQSAIRRFYTDTRRLASDSAMLSPTRDVYIGVAYRGGEDNGSKANLTAANAFYIDLDVGPGKLHATLSDAHEALSRFSPQPSFTVTSGSGLHVYWLLENPWPLAEAESIATFENFIKRLALALGGDRAATDASRVLRVPETLNHKTSPPLAVGFAGEVLRRRYGVEDFAGLPELDTPSAPSAPAPTGGLELDDERLIARAMAAANGSKFTRVWNGDFRDYNSRSEADAGLVAMLAYWTGRDANRIDRLFRRSGLYRDKWDSPRGSSTYGATSIEYVLSKSGETHSGHRNGAGAPREVVGVGGAPDAASERRSELTLHETDLGNAVRFVSRHGDDVRHVWPWAKWLVWDGKRWRIDDTGAIYRHGKDAVRAIFDEAGAAEGLDRVKALGKHALQSQAEARIEAMLSLARSEPGIPARPDDLDKDPWLFNCESGVIDLRTGELRQHDRGDLITKLAPVSFDPRMTCPTWSAFLDRVLADDSDLKRFVQKAIGYSLTGDVSEQVLFFAHGRGANGKTTMLETAKAMMGDYATQAAPGLLTAKRGERHPTELADLAGARFVVSAEVDEGRHLAEARVKWLTGGDKVKARRMRENFWEFDSTFKIWLAANHRPTIKGQDLAIWRRLRLLPFDVTIPPAEQDKALPAKLRAELPGILNWALEGCLAWQREGLDPPKRVQAATEEYRQESDTVGNFVADCCVVGEGNKTLANDLYGEYRTWCGKSGEEPLTQTLFGRRLSDRGFAAGRLGGRRETWRHGLGLATSPEMNFDQG